MRAQGPDAPAADESAAAAHSEGEGAGPVAPSPVETPPAGKKGKKKSYGVLFWLAIGWLTTVVVCALFADILPVANPNAQTVRDRLSVPFENGYILGTDGLGRDILARLVHGARVSLVISLSAVSIGMVVGGTLGLTVGFFRGRLEQLVMSAIDVILAFPGLVLLLALVAFVGQSLPVIAIVIGLLSIPVYTRVSRANTLSVSQREFVLAARAMGARNGRILFREIMPNVILPVFAFGLIAMGIIIVLEGSLAFLGLSVQAPQATWGGMIAEGKRHLNQTAHVALIPSATMFLTVLSLNFVGDVLRSRYDVKESNL
jgi:peptide/nickel transport system permease protein